jgi:hypothetical protein
MNTTKSSKAGSSKPSASTAATATTTTASSTPCGCGCGGKSGCGCGCHHHHGHESCGCCRLTCFERPKYFCGQLLSDADLTLQETYFREKNKLYHRSLDGFGVVCGLQMRCDAYCKGHIVVGDGYAIDCCGNDLVVCEPYSFDVIGELRRRKWLVEMPRDCRPPVERENPNDPEERECIDKRCFYIGICYSEEPLDFATPYTTECNPGPGPCQPTRIREGVRFEIYEELPVRPKPLDEIEKRIECCFKLYREGQFARGLRQLAPRIRRVLGYDDRPSEGREEPKAHHVFEELRAQFLYELRTCPDNFNCDLEHRVCALRPPARGDDDFAPAPIEAFTNLFELIQGHVYSCVLAQLAFPCPEPTDPCCVLIGSVEVVNGRLTRVINYPRWYLWCFANFWEVLIYTLAYDAACARPEQSRDDVYEARKRREGGCCPQFDVDVRSFLTLFEVENRATQFTALASVNAIRAIRQSLVSGFDFLKPGGVAPGIFDKLNADQAHDLAKTLGLNVAEISDAPTERRDPYSALLANLVQRGSDPMALFRRDDRVTGATRIMTAPAWPASPPDSKSQPVEDRIRQIEDDLRALKESLPKQPGDQGGGGGNN